MQFFIGMKELINKHNKVLYAVSYQHFTNAREFI